MSKKIFFFIILSIVAVVMIFFSKNHKKHKDPTINLSGLELKDLNGNIINFKTLYGKPLIINFWATWCGPCREEFPNFENAYKKYNDKINFLMVSAETPDKILIFKNKNNYTLPLVQSQQQFNALGITSIPVTCIFSDKGQILYTIKTVLSEKELNVIITELLKTSIIK